MKNKKLVREIALGIMMVLVGIFFWFSVHEALEMRFAYDTLTLVGWGSLIYALISFSLLLTFIGLFSTLARTRWVIYLMLALTALTPLTFFIHGNYSLFIVISSFLILWFYQRSCREETEARFKFSITRSTYFGQSIMVLVLLVAVALVYYVAVSGEDKEGRTLETSIVQNGTQVLNRIMEDRVEGYDPEMSFDDWLGNLEIQKAFETIPQFLGEGIISEEFIDEIKETEEFQEAEEEVKREAVIQLRQQFIEQFDIEAEGTDPMSEVLRKLVEGAVGKVVTPYTKFISPVLAISLFLVLRLLTPLYIILARVFQWLIFSILLKSNFIKVKKEQKEVVTISLGVD